MEHSHHQNYEEMCPVGFYFVRQLKRAHLATSELLTFYLCCIRPVAEYACQLFHNALPKYLSADLERIQKRALKMMAGSSLSRINGLGEFCMPADGCRGRCAKHKPCCIADRFGCRWKLLTGWSFALYVSFSFLLLHLFCSIRTYGLHCPRPCASFRGYSPPVAMNVVVFQ